MPTLKRRKCPQCGASDILPIIYGLPGPDMMRDYHEGKVMLGGCVVTDQGDPDWHCSSCEYEWVKDPPKPKRATTKDAHKWEFKPRFRANSFGWREQPAVQAIRQAVAEITRVARKEPALAAEGAVQFLERVSPAIQQVDGSSGSIGTAVNNAVEKLVPIIANAPADTAVNDAWLERLFAAHEADQMPYIESLGDYWGQLCRTREVASIWADRLIDVTRLALSSDKKMRGYFHGTVMCLGALFAAERYDELTEIASNEGLWHYKGWAVKAIAAQGKIDEALRLAELSRNSWSSDLAIDRFCEETLRAAGRSDEAYSRYGLSACRSNTYLGWFRNVGKKYPGKSPAQILADLVAHTPGDEGKWFAAAKDAGLFDEAIALANQTFCSPQTLGRAARDFAGKNPHFAIESGIAALRWIVEGYGYDITSRDVIDAYRNAMIAAANAGIAASTLQRIKNLVTAETYGDRFVTKVLGRELGLPAR